MFKKKSSAKEFVQRLRPHYAEVVSLVNSIDGPFVNIYEAGIFVATLASIKILTFKKVEPVAFADEFNHIWISYLIDSYSVDGENPSKHLVLSRLQEKFPIYRELFCETLNYDNNEETHDSAVQLMWELFSNCTGKQRPTSEFGFINLVGASGPLVIIGVNVLKDIEE